MSFRKLQSGNWNLRIYVSQDPAGKKQYKSFTAPTKTDCKRLAMEWQAAHPDLEPSETKTTAEAVKAYISLKESVLSPSTVLGYQSLLQHNIEGFTIAGIRIDKLTTPVVQSWIAELAAKEMKPKTIKNIYGLLSATVEMFAPDIRLRVTLPQKIKPDLYCPSEQDISQLLKYARKKKNQDMVVSILLAAYIPARRGEICALEHEDFKNGAVTISKAMVKNTDGEWILKQPKTASSYRTVDLPDFVLKEIPKGTGRLIRYNPDQLSSAFVDYIQGAKLPHFRLHDLRHFGASMYLTTMSPRYVQDRGGWSSGYTMHRVYDNVIDLEKTRQTKIAFAALSKKTRKTKNSRKDGTRDGTNG